MLANFLASLVLHASRQGTTSLLSLTLPTMHSSLSRLHILSAAGLLGASALSAQILYDGGVYSQNFDADYPHDVLTPSTNYARTFTPNLDSVNPNLDGGTVGWVGWYAAAGGGAGLSTGVSPSVSNSDIRISDGTQSTQFALYIFRPAGTQDGALGSIVVNALSGLASPGEPVGFTTFGMRLVNNTSETLTQFTLGYTGEQWRVASNQTVAHTLDVSFQLGATSLVDGAWTSVPELMFTGPQVNANPGAAFNIDGNLEANQMTLGHTVFGINWEPGAELWIRWYDLNDPGTDHALGIDNVQFSAAIPEPSTSVLLGLAGLAAAAFRRRRR